VWASELSFFVIYLTLPRICERRQGGAGAKEYASIRADHCSLQNLLYDAEKPPLGGPLAPDRQALSSISSTSASVSGTSVSAETAWALRASAAALQARKRFFRARMSLRSIDQRAPFPTFVSVPSAERRNLRSSRGVVSNSAAISAVLSVAMIIVPFSDFGRGPVPLPCFVDEIIMPHPPSAVKAKIGTNRTVFCDLCHTMAP